MTILVSSPFTQSSGRVDQCNAIFQFSNSLGIATRIESSYYCNANFYNWTSYPRTASWMRGTDCCKWDGITCDNVTGDVIEVNLSCSRLQGILHVNSTLFSLRNLRALYLRGNGLTGHIPSSICQMTSLETLSLSDNKLDGPIPPCLGNLTKISSLSLSFNHIRGSLPRSLANCTRLENLFLYSNDITDSFPHWLRTVPLRLLHLGGNNFHGPVGADPLALNFPLINDLILSLSNFTGSLPFDYFLHSNLTYIYLSESKFEGNLPILPPTVKAYDISGNKFTGGIPPLICNSTNLKLIRMSNNRLTGSIPWCLMKASTNLLELTLSMNFFQGPIPNISALNNCSLKTFDLSENNLEGKLPRFLANCSNLGELDFSNNELEDLFPSWLEALPSLYVLGLRSNKFHGLVKSSRSAQPFPRLHIFDISNNNFSGAFPTQYIASFKGMMGGDKVRGNLLFQEHGVRNFYTTHVIGKGNILDLRRIHKTYTVIDLSCNHFQGEIPELIGDLKLLIGLNFSHNNLTGAIPYSLGNLTNLEWLDLSFNNLTGKIPGSLADLTSLEYLNLSTNRLVGPIPEGKQLNTFQSDAFGGNPGLCGFPLQRQCGGDANEPPASSTLKDEENTNNGSWIEWQAVPLGYGCGTVLGLSVGYIILHFQRPLWLMRMIERRIYKLQRRARRTHER
ncbi:hypothetical protein CDL15_Pgr008865 [Punica granatum]|uniref:Leucine-rich repeat-containing N-terminal plant-type domain-containing protein n=1 Tax=Punica granatum TaxID=22663 RepID=A0A218VXR3_PUNGR|nr:hypothetical protein CDL15_Pgr008865 [Punica granatum]